MGDTYSNIPTAKAALEKYESILEDRKMLIGGVNLVGNHHLEMSWRLFPLAAENILTSIHSVAILY